MLNKDWYYPSNNKEILEYLLSKKHFICGAWKNKRLIGFTTVYEYNKYNYCIEDTVVHIDYRGQELQCRMWKYIKEKLVVKNVTLWCTIHPLNHISLNNACCMGFKIMNRKKLYNDSERYILSCKLSANNNP